MNRLEIRQAVQARIDDLDGIRTTTEELNRYIDDGYADLAERSGAVVRTATLTASPGQHYVPVPDDMIYPLVMRDVGTGLPIDFEDWTFIDRCDRTFIRWTAPRPEMVAMWGLGEMLLNRAYDLEGSMEVIYAAIPDALGDSDEPELPAQHHEALVHYAHARSLLKDAHGDIATKRIGKAKARMGEYMAMAGALQKWNFDRLGIRQTVIGNDNLRIRDVHDFQTGNSNWGVFGL